MKKLFIISFLIFVQSSLFAYTWVPYCPDSIHATNICFGLGSAQGLICSTDGMYIYEDDLEWHHYSYAEMPVVEAAWFSWDKILVIMSDGSWSDGIYTFDLQTHEFEVQEWFANPKFLKLNPFGIISTYYAGGANGGLKTSVDGITWYSVPYFDTIPCSSMDFYEEHIVICEWNYKNENTHLSSDGGASWFGSINGDNFSKVKFNYDGELFAVYPGASNSSGLYKSYDFGLNWEVVNWEIFISCLGYDAWGYVFTGWDNGDGIAMLDPDVMYPPFNYLNEGLPDTHVNEITMNPYMSAIVIFCCTNSGVYWSIDYMVGERENEVDKNELLVFPNPVNTGQHVKIQLPGSNKLECIEIFTASGRLLKSMAINPIQGQYDFQTNGLGTGTYIMRIKTLEGDISKKLVVR